VRDSVGGRAGLWHRHYCIPTEDEGASLSRGDIAREEKLMKC